MLGKFKHVLVRFNERNTLSNTAYSYITDFPVAVNDVVIATTKYGPGIATVVQTKAIPKSKKDCANTLLICKVPDCDIEQRIADYNKYTELKDRLREYREEFDEMQFLTLMAKSNPEAKKLMDELQSLNTSPSPVIAE